MPVEDAAAVRNAMSDSRVLERAPDLLPARPRSADPRHVVVPGAMSESARPQKRDERARGAALGADAYVVKPVSRDALLEALADVGVLPSAPEGVEAR